VIFSPPYSRTITHTKEPDTARMSEQDTDRLNLTSSGILKKKPNLETGTNSVDGGVPFQNSTTVPLSEANSGTMVIPGLIDATVWRQGDAERVTDRS
jgi:hypothetical protein